MKVYKDIFTGDEMFTDTYKMNLADDVIYEVFGSLVTRNQDNIVLAGANPSAEEEDEGADASVESGVDVVLNHRLQESFAFTDKKSFTLYLKDYMKKVLEHLQQTAPAEVDVLKTNMNKAMKDILGRFRELQFFTGESMDIDGMVAMCEYRQVDGEIVPVLMFFKHGLQEEKL
ncbi:PREDICTED: translationally-controlled tumor protein homolog [Drosophila arizonae]|uniref:Translationally-controlled tumor protein homolog n=1 Tax=Drosophila arizonae TaxID=7263 RepID=A0ABM1PG59_DROAR|nr:PREDICTED: translationally-controlled tumor protein homolog [Drosophila arizonae]